MVLGERIRELRKKKGLTQQELANMINLTKVSISCYESGTRTPNLETFTDLVDALDTTPDYLLGRDKLLVSESNEDYKIYVSKEELDILKELNKNKEIINFLRSDPKRSVEYIVKKIK